MQKKFQKSYSQSYSQFIDKKKHPGNKRVNPSALTARLENKRENQVTNGIQLGS